MFEQTKKDFARFREGKPGNRFQAFCEYRIQMHGGRYSFSRLLSLVLGFALLFGGLAIGWLPGPGGFITIFGLALLAQEFRPLARLLDWLEPRFWRGWRRTVAIWRRLSAGSQVLVVASVLLAASGLGYAAITLVAERW